MKSRILSFALFASLLLNSLLLGAQERRALVVGINSYAAPAQVPVGPRGPIRDLKGAVNDARAMQAILINRFQFPPQQIETLFDQQATRDGILNALRKLLNQSQTNDVAVFFYAGHGSQVKNSLSKETDQKDETIVPADAWKPGTKDIRDKELAAIYNQFLDKGVNLTVINDCCHSGSLSRGPQPPPVYRFTADASYDAKDDSDPTPPETRTDKSFLIISAAQSDELAQEQPSPDQIAHGAFTLALTEALEQIGPNASTLKLFSTARAILKSNGKKQEPVLGGTRMRQEQTLFGLTKGEVPDVTQVAVMDDPSNPMSRRKVFLQGGFAVGLRKENELLKLDGKDTLAFLVVDSVYGPNRSHARLIKGDLKNLKAGEYLKVTNWISSTAPLLNVYIPPALGDKQLSEWVATGIQLKKTMGSNWMTELDKEAPEQSIYADGNGLHLNANGKRTTLGTSFSAASIQKNASKNQLTYFEIPPAQALVNAFSEEIKRRQNPNIQIVNDPALAQYWLVGIVDEKNQLAYRLRRADINPADSLGSLPLLTRAYSLPTASNGTIKTDGTSIAQITEALYEKAKAISKVRGWIQLAAPINESAEFPFSLVIRDRTNGQIIGADQYKMGQPIQLFLEANESARKSNMKKRYVYLFMIDRDGQMQLLYPSTTGGNVDNQFPRYRENELIRSSLLVGGKVMGPIGTDTYLLLATDEAIPNYTQVFSQEGVRSVSTPFALKAVLMTGMEGNTRSNTKTPTNWSLTRRSMICTQ